MSGAWHQRGGRIRGGSATTMSASPLQQGQPVRPASVSPPATSSGDGGGVWGANSPVSPQLREQSGSSAKTSPSPPPSPSHMSRKVTLDRRTNERQVWASPVSGAGASPGESLSGSRSEESNGGGRKGNKTFDIFRCPSAQAAPRLQPSLLVSNKERRAQKEKARSGPGHQIPRPGMVLLKNYLSHENQVQILTRCRALGLASGGFYRPGYRDGAKLSLQMMCLGKNWDPETKRYEETRSYDGAEPPGIPVMFKNLVTEAMLTAHELIKEMGQGDAMKELPDLSPDICIVNFYEASGKLGLHQDRDESEDSLLKGLPVVSFSIGDSAIFKYGDTRIGSDEIKLESGDVLIFGGKSRHVFHGITTIEGSTAPKRLIEETLLRPGRLNLTFRQY